MLVVVPSATPHLLVMCATHKRPKPSMSGHLAASAPAPPAVLSIGRHALHITSPCIDRHRCAEATDAAAPLARASLFCGLLASLPLPLHVATTPAVHTATTARVLNAFLPTVHVGTLHSLPATAVWAAHGAPHATTRAVVTFWFGVHWFGVHASVAAWLALLAVACGATVLHHTTTRTELPCGRTAAFLNASTTRVLDAFLPVVHVGTLHSLPATAEWATHRAPHNGFGNTCSTRADTAVHARRQCMCLDQLFTVVFALGALALGALNASTTRVLEALLPMEHVGLLHSLPATAECAAHGAPHAKARTVVTFWFGVHEFWFALLAVTCGATVLHHTTTPTELPCGRTTSALCLGDFDRGDLIVPGRATLHLVIDQTAVFPRLEGLVRSLEVVMLIDGGCVSLWNLQGGEVVVFNALFDDPLGAPRQTDGISSIVAVLVEGGLGGQIPLVRHLFGNLLLLLLLWDTWLPDAGLDFALPSLAALPILVTWFPATLLEAFFSIVILGILVQTPFNDLGQVHVGCGAFIPDGMKASC